MNDSLDYKPTADEIWPPAPTLPPPERVRLQSLFVRGGILVPVLISTGEGMVGFGTNYLQQWTSHKHHFIDQNEVYYMGAMMFTLLLPVNIWSRARILKQRRQEAAALAVQIRAAERDATE